MTDPVPSSDPLEYHCPNCNQILDSTAIREGTLTCPNCGQEITLGTATDAGPIDNEGSSENQGAFASEEPDQAELNSLKIRQFSVTYRGRSWLIVAAIACLDAAAQLIYFAVRGYRLGVRAVPLEEVSVAVVALLFSVYFFHRARDLTRELRKSKLAEPATPPDFSSLRDGSQRWKNLEEMTNQKDED